MSETRRANVEGAAYFVTNPVEQGIVTEAHHYRLSSAHLDGPLVLNGYLERVEGKGLI